MDEYWGACQTMPGREHLIRADIEEAGRGAFLPTLARTWVREGKLCATEAPAVAGYVFFRTTAEGWGQISCIEGVQQVLVNKGRAMRISDSDMARMVLGHATGAHNDFGAKVAGERRERKNSRKPRPGKRIRVRNVAST